MHYYKRNIGDYHRKAGRLNMIQHGAYTLIMDACYDREKFPSRDEAIDWCWASTPEEVAAVDFVLSKFFVLQEGLYVQDRVSEEIGKYHGNCETNQRIAREREESRRNASSTNRAQDVNEPPPNQEPRTKNQEPENKPASPDAPLRAADLVSLGIPDKVAKAYLGVRKAKKGGPLTQVALDGIQREAKAAGYTLEQALTECCERSWVGFKAKWVSDSSKPQEAAPAQPAGNYRYFQPEAKQ